LTVKSTKDEIQRIQVDLDEQIALLESEEKIKENFHKINKRYDNKNKFLDLAKFSNPDLKIAYTKVGCANFKNGTPVIISGARNQGSYWSERSEDLFEGPVFARLKIHNITRTSDWSLNIGLIRDDYTNDNTYYQGGVFFMCSGRITVQFQGNQGRNFMRRWNNGDEVLIRRDDKNTVFFGLNDENVMEQAFTNIAGKFRICVGFSSGMTGDHIEIVEVDY